MNTPKECVYCHKHLYGLSVELVNVDLGFKETRERAHVQCLF